MKAVRAEVRRRRREKFNLLSIIARPARALKAQEGNIKANEGCFGVSSLYFRPAAAAQRSALRLDGEAAALVKRSGLVSA